MCLFILSIHNIGMFVYINYALPWFVCLFVNINCRLHCFFVCLFILTIHYIGEVRIKLVRTVTCKWRTLLSTATAPAQQYHRHLIVIYRLSAVSLLHRNINSALTKWNFKGRDKNEASGSSGPWCGIDNSFTPQLAGVMKLPLLQSVMMKQCLQMFVHCITKQRRFGPFS